MDIRKIIANSNPEIKEWTQSKQYKYSRELMALRYQESMSCQEMSDYLNISFEKYVELEYGSLYVDLDKYKHVFDKINS